jgi:hypothetical protein
MKLILYRINLFPAGRPWTLHAGAKFPQPYTHFAPELQDFALRFGGAVTVRCNTLNIGSHEDTTVAPVFLTIWQLKSVSVRPWHEQSPKSQSP